LCIYVDYFVVYTYCNPIDGLKAPGQGLSRAARYCPVARPAGACGRIFALLPRIVEFNRNAELVLDLSVDEIGEAHDRQRGAPGNFAKRLEVASFIRDLKKTHKRSVLGVHTVVSKAKVERVPIIERELRRAFAPDSFITEAAEKRVELATMDRDITPSAEAYARAAAHLRESIAGRRSSRPLARLVEAFRYEYYGLAAHLGRKPAGHRLLCRLGQRSPRPDLPRERREPRKRLPAGQCQLRHYSPRSGVASARDPHLGLPAETCARVGTSAERPRSVDAIPIFLMNREFDSPLELKDDSRGQRLQWRSTFP